MKVYVFGCVHLLSNFPDPGRGDRWLVEEIKRPFETAVDAMLAMRAWNDASGDISSFARPNVSLPAHAYWLKRVEDSGFDTIDEWSAHR